MSMDPDEALKRIREGVKEYYSDGWTTGQGDELVQDVKDLDEWMTKGGFVPSQWRRNNQMGPPRRLKDGVVLEDVEHGTRGSYNRGCRCMGCTAANRIAGANYRAKKKEKTDDHV